MITAEHWIDNIDRILDEYNLSKEEFWQNPEEFLDGIEDVTIRVMIEAAMLLS